ncbi:unnamed protein product [Alternaria alternata]
MSLVNISKMEKPRAQIILVMGVTGVGKSTFIKHATGCDVVVGHTQTSCTSKVEIFQIPGTSVYLMDSPGFDDTNISDTQILRSIATALVDAFHDNVEIHGALYIHPVVEARMRGSGRKNLIMFKKVLGMKGMKNCRLVTTKWTQVNYETAVAREKELCEKEEFWQPLIAAGATTIRFGDTMQSAFDIIRPFVYGPSFKPQLVEELRDGKTLPQTAAGQVVNDDVEEAKRAHEVEMKQLEKDQKDALVKKDFEFAEIIKVERKEQAAKIERLEEEARLLQKPIPEGVGRFERWLARAAVIIAGAFAVVTSGGVLAPQALLLYGATEAAIR